MSSGGGGTGTYCTGGKGAMVTVRYSVDPARWNSVLSVAVGNVGGHPVASAVPPGGYGTGYGGGGYYSAADNYGTGGGGGSSVAVGVSVYLQSPCFSRAEQGTALEH